MEREGVRFHQKTLQLGCMSFSRRSEPVRGKGRKIIVTTKQSAQVGRHTREYRVAIHEAPLDET